MMEIILSKRMQAVANLVTPGGAACDVGCDHGYVSIYLIQNEICEKMLAMDVRPGPLSQAKIHIEQAGLADRIETRLSDGLEKVTPGECEAIILAGMGGKLMIRILEDGREVVEHCRELILQPQSDIEFVRHYLFTNGFSIVDEDMVLEDGKFYPMMRVVRETPDILQSDERHQKYGPILLETGHPVLRLYLEKQLATTQAIIDRLMESDEQHPKLSEMREKELELREVIDYVSM